MKINNNQKTLGTYERFGSIIQMKKFIAIEKGRLMTNQLKILDDSHCLKEFGWTKSQFETIQKTYFQNMDIDQIKIFGHVCKHTGLDPFLKQIYPVVRQGKMCIQTAIDGYRLIAERTGKYSPGKEPTFVYKNDNTILSSTAYVKKMTLDGTWHEVAATAYFDEYCATVGPFWKKMPHVMISKCAEALALRKAFPAELSAIRTEDEMDQSSIIESLIVKTEFKREEPIQNISETLNEEQLKIISELLDLCCQEYVECFYKNIKQHWNIENLKDIQSLKFEALISKIQIHLNEKEVVNV